MNDYHAFRNTFFERKNDVKTMKQKFSMDTLNDNINNAKSYPVTVLHSPFCDQKNFPFGCFLAADRGDIYIINALTLKISLVILLTVCPTVLVMFFWRIWYWIKLMIIVVRGKFSCLIILRM